MEQTPAAFVAAWLDAHPMPGLTVLTCPASYRATLIEALTALLTAYTGSWQREAQYWQYLRQFATHASVPIDAQDVPRLWAISSPFLGDINTGYATVEEAMEAQMRLEEEARRAVVP